MRSDGYGRAGSKHPVHLTHKKARELGLWFDEQAADRACEFFERFLRHGKGARFAGRPFRLLPWQALEFIRPLFGWRRREDGTRRFRRMGLWVPKKNGKTPLAAGIELYGIVADGEFGAESYSAATTRDQAGLIFKDAMMMVRLSPALKKQLKIIDSTKTIMHPPTFSTMKVLSREAGASEGINASTVIADELHAFKDRKLWDALIGSGASRAQPIFGSASTAGVYDPDSIGWEQWDYAQRVLDGTIEDPYFLALIYAMDPEGNWRKPRNWYRANPSLGVTVMESYIAERVREAENDPKKKNALLRYHFNVWVQAVEQWLDIEQWKAAERIHRPIYIGVDGHMNLDPEAVVGMRCFGGIDLAKNNDFSCLALAFEGPGGSWHTPLWCWMPEEVIGEEVRQGHEQWRLWADQGWIRVVPGWVMDPEFVWNDIKRILKRWRPVDVGYDPYFAWQLAAVLEKDGITPVMIPQTMAQLAAPTSELDRLVKKGLLNHGGNPVLTWMAGNVAVHFDDKGNYKPDRKRSLGKIDGVAAVLNAMGRAMRDPGVQQFVYTGMGG